MYCRISAGDQARSQWTPMRETKVQGVSVANKASKWNDCVSFQKAKTGLILVPFTFAPSPPLPGRRKINSSLRTNQQSIKVMKTFILPMGIILLTSCAPKNPNNESRTVDSKYPKYSNTKKQAPEGSLGGSIEGFYPDPPNFDSMSNHEIEEYITSDDPTDPVSLDISSIYKSIALKALIGNINSNRIHKLVLNLNPIILDNNRPNHLRHRLLRNYREIIDNTFHTEPTLLPTNEKQQIYNSIYSLLDTFTTQYHPFLTTNALTLHVKMDECSS